MKWQRRNSRNPLFYRWFYRWNFSEFYCAYTRLPFSGLIRLVVFFFFPVPLFRSIECVIRSLVSRIRAVFINCSSSSWNNFFFLYKLYERKDLFVGTLLHRENMFDRRLLQFLFFFSCVKELKIIINIYILI